MYEAVKKSVVWSQDHNPMPYPFKSENRKTLGSEGDFAGNDPAPIGRAADTSKPRPTS